jgi:uncharacterized protein (TIGR02147 family)
VGSSPISRSIKNLIKIPSFSNKTPRDSAHTRIQRSSLISKWQRFGNVLLPNAFTITQSLCNIRSMRTETTTNHRKTPVDALRAIFVNRKEKNTNYSLNAFARDLDLSPSFLSRILNGTRALTLKQGMHIAALLGFNQNETNLFILGIIENAAPTAKISKKVKDKIQKELELSTANTQLTFDSPLYVNYDIERFKAISQWYHLAILNMTYLKGFKSDATWISNRLGISKPQAQEAIERLVEFGFLEESIDGKIKKSQAHFYFKTERSELAMRTYQSQMIQKSQDHLTQKTSEQDFAQRLINSITFPCSEKHVELLKKKIHEFQDEALALIKADQNNYQQVYQLNCQLFPLTKRENKREN